MFQIEIERDGQVLFRTTGTASLELGRQRPGEPDPFAVVASGTGQRLVIASATAVHISRRQILIRRVSSDITCISNISQTRSITLASGERLLPGDSADLALPIRVLFSDRAVVISQVLTEDIEVVSLAHHTIPPGRDPQELSVLMEAAGRVPGSKLVSWLSLAMNVLQSAASDPDFLDKAAQSSLQIVGLSTAAVVMLEDGNWVTHAYCSALPNADVAGWSPSQTILEQVRSEGHTVRHLPKGGMNAPSLMGVEALVAAPILDREGDVIGALYGDRQLSPQVEGQPDISELDAILVELLASGVAAGLARVEQERAALEARVRFEQYFTPSLAQHLTTNPSLLSGRDADVSILFCDIRGFSRISQRLGPMNTMLWIGAVMDELSEPVFQQEGVLVDYIGDELMAMWGAPENQLDHACRACTAALAMLRSIKLLNKQWEHRLGEPLSVAIGICSGTAHVGNTGSKKKFKYGPLGSTVNLASRIQGATKYLHSDLLISGPTAAGVRDKIKLRRLARVFVVNVPQAVELFEVLEDNDAMCQEQIATFEAALDAFERKDFAAAKAGLIDFLRRHPSDGPARVLWQRLERTKQGDTAAGDAVWHLPGK